jgi:hypothetical protein
MNEHDSDELSDVMKQLRSSFAFETFELGDCPVFLVNALPIKAGVTGKRIRLPSGRGLSLAQASLAAAGEATELLASLAQNADQGNHGFETRNGLTLVQARALAGGFAVPLLAQRVFLDWAALHGEPLVEDATSSGCAAGLSLAEALQRGMLECIERDAMAIWWYGRQSRLHFPLSVLDNSVPRLAWWLERRQRRVCLIDITSSLGIQTVAACSAEADGSRIAIGAAAAASAIGATVSAITEMVQTEAAMQASRPEDNEELATWYKSASFDDMPQFQNSGMARLAPEGGLDPLQSLTDQGFQVLGVDLTRNGDVLHSARVVIQGLCAMGRKIDKERILKHVRDNPQFGGAQRAEDFESTEPY